MNFDWAEFASNAAAAAIGAVAAFVFAIWLAKIENKRQARERLLETKRTNMIATMSAVDACAQNIEELINIKEQWTVNLSADANKVRQLIEIRDFEKLKIAAAELKVFFLEMQTASVPAMPASDKFAFALESVPQITMFVHRAASSVEQVNISIKSRNEMVRRWADVGRVAVSNSDIHYFFTMLYSFSDAITSQVDDALFFNHLLHDQCYYMGLEMFSRPNFRHVVLTASKLAYMPAADHLRGFRNDVVTFGFPPVSLTSG